MMSVPCEDKGHVRDTNGQKKKRGNPLRGRHERAAAAVHAAKWGESCLVPLLLPWLSKGAGG